MFQGAVSILGPDTGARLAEPERYDVYHELLEDPAIGAWRAATGQPRKFMQQLHAGLSRLSPDTRAALEDVIGRKKR